MLLTAAYAILFALWGCSYFVVLPVNVNLVATAVSIIVIGCHRSLALTPLLHDHCVPEHVTDGVASQPQEPRGPRDTLSSSDAMMFPVIGSITLFSLYCAFKYLDPAYVQVLLTAYFMIAGVAALTATFGEMLRGSDVVRGALDSRGALLDWKFHVHVPLLHAADQPGEAVHLLLRPSDLLASVPALVINILYSQSRHFLLNNMIGIAFCVQAVESVSLGSYKTAAMLLCGLFLYDIFWVFGTEVMVTVAKSVKGPLLLQFPRAFVDAAVEGSKDEFSMLGLGDIVVPGLFVALLLRLDTTQHLRTLLKPAEGAANEGAALVFPPSLSLAGLREGRYPRPYFIAGLVGYAAGLVCTVFVMLWFKAAQPALLYLVPCCLLASLIVGLAKGEFLAAVWPYNEEEAAAVVEGGPAKAGEHKKSE